MADLAPADELRAAASRARESLSLGPDAVAATADLLKLLADWAELDHARGYRPAKQIDAALVVARAVNGSRTPPAAQETTTDERAALRYVVAARELCIYEHIADGKTKCGMDLADARMLWQDVPSDQVTRVCPDCTGHEVQGAL